MAKKAKPRGPNVGGVLFQGVDTADALKMADRMNQLLGAGDQVSPGELIRLVREELARQRGGRLDSISAQADAFANQLAQQARGGGVAGFVEPPASQLEFQFVADTSRPLYVNPRPLEEAFEIAADQGVPMGYKVADGQWHDLKKSDHIRDVLDLSNRNEFLARLRQELIDKGVPGAEIVPLSKGAYSTAFGIPQTDEVVKFTWSGPGQYTNKADGVWGVVSPRVVESIPTNNPYARPDLTYGIYPRADLGRATRKDYLTLRDALNDQGYMWYDDHQGNMGMLPGSEYRPVVIDVGDVSPLSSTGSVGRWPFKPPSGPLYNWLIPALAAGGTAALAGQASAGEETQAGDSTMPAGGGTLQMPIPQAGVSTLSMNSDGTVSQTPTAQQMEGSGGPDFSMAISPSEWSQWYDNPQAGYGGEEHQRFIESVEQAMDIPLIPERYITETLGFDREAWKNVFPGYEGGDMTPRMLTQGMSYAVIGPLMLAAMQEASAGITDGPATKRLEAYSQPGSDKQLVQDTISEFAGLRRDREDTAPSQAAQMVLAGIASGTPGQQFADREEVTRSEDRRLRASFASDRRPNDNEFMVTQGGANNYRREAALQILRTMQDGAFAPPNVTTMNAIGNAVWAGNEALAETLLGMEGTGEAARRVSSLMDTAPRGRMQLATQQWNSMPDWARMSAAQVAERRADPLPQMEPMPYDIPGMPQQQPRQREPGAFAQARQDGYEYLPSDSFDRFDLNSDQGLANYLYNNQSFTPAQYAQAADPLLGQLNDRLTLGNDSGDFTKQMNRDIDSVRPVRGDNESPEKFDSRKQWYANKKEADRDYRSAYWGPALSDMGNRLFPTGRDPERTFLSPTADMVANLPQDFGRNPYNWASVGVGGLAGGIRGALTSGLRGVATGAAKGAAAGAANEILDEAREEGAILAVSGGLDFTPQKENAFARDFDAPMSEWKDGMPPQLDPNDKDYWKKFNRAFMGHQGQAAGHYDSWKRGLLD